MTQTDKILKFMREGNRITPLDAMREFACMRLGARIYDLKMAGIPICSRTIRRTNRYGEAVHFKEYWIDA